MTNKTTIEFSFCIIWSIMGISEESVSADNTLLDLNNSSDHTQPHSMIVNKLHIAMRDLTWWDKNLDQVIDWTFYWFNGILSLVYTIIIYFTYSIFYFIIFYVESFFLVHQTQNMGMPQRQRCVHCMISTVNLHEEFCYY